PTSAHGLPSASSSLCSTGKYDSYKGRRPETPEVTEAGRSFLHDLRRPGPARGLQGAERPSEVGGRFRTSLLPDEQISQLVAGDAEVVPHPVPVERVDRFFVMSDGLGESAHFAVQPRAHECDPATLCHITNLLRDAFRIRQRPFRVLKRPLRNK